MKYATQLLLQIAAVIVLAVLPGPQLQAQQTPPRTGRGDALQLELLRQSERVMLERALAETPKDTSRRPSVVLAEFKVDFLGLQIANNNLMKAVSGGAALNLNLLSRSAAEIRKVARKLKVNLALPVPAETVAPARSSAGLGLEQLRPTALTLDHLIIEFVSNPVFESAKVVDVDLSAKARRDLNQIIFLSGELRKGSELLRQPASKTH